MKKTFTKLMLLAGLLMTATGAKAENDAFVVWNNTNKILYFAYGEVPAKDSYWQSCTGYIKVNNVWSGTDVTASPTNATPEWTNQFIIKNNCTKVIIEESFQSVTPTSLYRWFYSISNLIDIQGLQNLNTSNTTTMKQMFYVCSNLTALDLSSWNTAKVTDMTQMFSGCTLLNAIIVGDAWNTDAVTSSSNMFYNCNALVGEDGTNAKGITGYKANAHTGAAGFLTKKTVEVSATNVGGDYWSTYFKSNVNRVADANTTVYSAAQSGSKLVLTEVADKNIKAGEGVILKSTGATITLTSTTAAPATNYDSDLEGVDYAMAQTSGKTYYVLSNNSGIGFYKLNSGNKLAAQKAFLMLEGPVSAPELEFVFGNETTGVADVRSKMADGRSDFFDLQGRRVAQPTKGLYIVNGKKVVLH